MENKPKRVIAKCTVIATVYAIVELDRHGCISEYMETIEEFDIDNPELISIKSVISSY